MLNIWFLAIWNIAFNLALVWIAVPFVQILLNRSVSLSSAGLEGKLNGIVSGMITGMAEGERLLKVGTILVILYLGGQVTLLLRKMSVYRINYKVIETVRRELFDSVFQADCHCIGNFQAGEVSSLFVNDVNNLNAFLIDLLDRPFVLGMKLLFYLGLLIVISWQLVLVVSLSVPLVWMIVNRIGRMIRGKYLDLMKTVSEMEAGIVRDLRSFKIIAMFNQIGNRIDRFRGINQRYSNHLFRIKVIHLYNSACLDATRVMIMAGVLLVGSFVFLRSGEMTGDSILRFFALIPMLFYAVEGLSSMYTSLNQSLPSLKRIIVFIRSLQGKIVLAKRAELVEPQFERQIRITGLDVCIGEQNIIRNLNLLVRKGERIGIMGPNGSGKSTLLDVLCRFQHPDKGDILIDDKSIFDFELHGYRELIGLVPQDLIIEKGTIRDNVCYGRAGFSDQDVLQSLKLAGAWQFVSQKPGALECQIGPEGMGLSGGEKQRLVLARALLSDPPILLLDEFNSQIDKESERSILFSIGSLGRQKTIIMVSHNMEEISHLVDRVMFFRNGNLIQRVSG